MKKHFYSHLVETESLILELNEMDLTENEKIHLVSIIDSSLHYAILDAILSELSEEDKKIFLKHLASDKHEDIWELLDKKVENIEDKIKKAADDLKDELRKDIKEAK
ncbi:hypothetical protein M1349_04540 [Patescibacteria group bacterium]|nr:hypothetical protein [Patescibacteria group bacterium]